MSKAVANQMFVTFLGRPVDAQWLSSTGDLLGAMGDQPTLPLQKAFFNAAVAEGVFATLDIPSTLVNKIFLNVFGFAASTAETKAWGDLITSGAIAKEAAPWTIFASYMGATNVPDSYKLPAQFRLAQAEAHTSGLSSADNLKLSNGGEVATQARSWLGGVNYQLPVTEASGLLSVTASLSSSLSVDLSTDKITLGTSSIYPASGKLESVVNVDLSGLKPVASTATTTTTTTTKSSSTTSTAPVITVSIKGDDQANTITASGYPTTIEAGKGADTIVCGSAADTVKFASLPASNGVDAISNFTLGKSGDVLNFSAFLNKTGTGNTSAVLATTTAAKTWANGDVLVVQGNALDATSLAGLFGVGHVYAAPTTAGKAVVIACDIIGDATIWYLINQTSTAAISSDELTQAGTLVGINNLALVGFDATNFA